MRKRYLQRFAAPLCAATLLATAAPAAAQSGTIDTSFVFPMPTTQPVSSVAALPGGKVLIGGSRFNTSGPIDGVLRLNSDGTPDPTWISSNWTGFANAYPDGVQHLLALPGGKYLSAGTSPGNFFLIQGIADGTYDAGFNNLAFASGTLRAVARQSTGHILLGGDQQAGTHFLTGITRLNANGSPATFNGGSGISIQPTLGGHTVNATNASVTAIAIQPDDKIVIAGRFTHYNGVETGNIARLNADGSLDNTFNAGLGSFDIPTGQFVDVNDLEIGPSGTVYAATSLPTKPNANRIVRLTSTGAHDAGFLNLVVYGGPVHSIDVLSNGMVLVGGNFLVAGPTTGAGVALLKADGDPDTDFRIGMNAGFAQPGFNGVRAVTASADESKVYAVGNFSLYDGTPRLHVARINISSATPLTGNKVVCSGTSLSGYSFGTVPAGYTVTWTNSEPSIGLAASGTGDIPAFTATNNGSAPVTAEIRITATEDATGQSKTIVFRVTVKPVPTVNAVSNRALCTGQPASIAFSGSMTGTTYSWTNSNTAIGLSAIGTNNISFTAMNPANSLQLATVTVTPTNDHCAGESKTFFIGVSPSAGSIAYTQSMYCQSGSAFVRMTNSSGGGTFSATPGGLAINASTGQVSLSSSTPGTYTVTYTVAAVGPCPATATTQITIMSQASVNPVPNQDLCLGMASNQITFSGTATSFTWTNSNPGIGLAPSGSGHITSFTPTATGNASIRVSPQGPPGTCPGKDFVFQIRVGSCTVNTPGDTGGGSDAGRMNLLSVSPNPASSNTLVQYTGTEQGPFVLEVVNAFGQPALRPVQVSGKTARLELSGLLPGVYQLRFTNSRTGVVLQKQVIKL